MVLTKKWNYNPKKSLKRYLDSYDKPFIQTNVVYKPKLPFSTQMDDVLSSKNMSMLRNEVKAYQMSLVCECNKYIENKTEIQEVSIDSKDDVKCVCSEESVKEHKAYSINLRNDEGVSLTKIVAKEKLLDFDNIKRCDCDPSYIQEEKLASSNEICECIDVKEVKNKESVDCIPPFNSSIDIDFEENNNGVDCACEKGSFSNNSSDCNCFYPEGIVPITEEEEIVCECESGTLRREDLTCLCESGELLCQNSFIDSKKDDLCNCLVNDVIQEVSEKDSNEIECECTKVKDSDDTNTNTKEIIKSNSKIIDDNGETGKKVSIDLSDKEGIDVIPTKSNLIVNPSSSKSKEFSETGIILTTLKSLTSTTEGDLMWLPLITDTSKVNVKKISSGKIKSKTKIKKTSNKSLTKIDSKKNTAAKKPSSNGDIKDLDTYSEIVTLVNKTNQIVNVYPANKTRDGVIKQIEQPNSQNNTVAPGASITVYKIKDTPKVNQSNAIVLCNTSSKLSDNFFTMSVDKSIQLNYDTFKSLINKKDTHGTLYLDLLNPTKSLCQLESMSHNHSTCTSMEAKKNASCQVKFKLGINRKQNGKTTPCHSHCECAESVLSILKEDIKSLKSMFENYLKPRKLDPNIMLLPTLTKISKDSKKIDQKICLHKLKVRPKENTKSIHEDHNTGSNTKFHDKSVKKRCKAL